MYNIKVEAKTFDAANELLAAINNGLANAGLAIEADAKANAPVDSGELRRSITTVVDEEKLEAKVGTNLDYAPYVHEGTGVYYPGSKAEIPWTYYSDKLGRFVKTSGQPPRPFLRDAFDKNLEDIPELIKTGANTDG